MLVAAERLYRDQAALAKRAKREGIKRWGRSPMLATIALIELQREAADLSMAALPAMLDEQGITAPPIAEPNPAVMFGTSAATQFIRQAATPVDLARLFATITNDTCRVTTGIGVMTRPRVSGHVRYLSPPSCARCAILAGRFYRWSSGFQRHVSCDCQMIPTTRSAAPDLVSDPEEAFKRGQIRNSRIDKETGERIYSRGFSKADEQAIRDGADMARVVNVRSKKAGLSMSGRVLARNGAPTPEGIYRMASDRDEALRLLERFGYIR